MHMLLVSALRQTSPLHSMSRAGEFSCLSPSPMDSLTPPPHADSAPPPVSTLPAADLGSAGSPTAFLKGVVGKEVVVRLVSGVDYRGAHPSTFNWLFPSAIAHLRIYIRGAGVPRRVHEHRAGARGGAGARARDEPVWGCVHSREQRCALPSRSAGGLVDTDSLACSAVYIGGGGAVDRIALCICIDHDQSSLC